MSFTLLPNTAVGVGGLPSGTTMTALRDNAEEAAWFSHTWQNLTASRAVGTAYQNTTGRQIQILILVNIPTVSEGIFEVANNPSFTSAVGIMTPPAQAGRISMAAVVPSGIYYRFRAVSGTPNITSWAELR